MKFRINSLVKGSFILMITFGLFNFLNYIYHFSMARFLTVAEYGIVATLFSMIYILGIFTESIQTVMTKFSSAEKEPGRLKNLFKRAEKKGLSMAIKVYAAFLIFSIFLSPLLKIPYGLMALTGIIIFTSFLLPVSRGIMQGLKRFKALGINMVLESAIKLVLALFFVFIGWKAYGAMAGAVLGTIGALILSYPALVGILKSRERETKVKSIYSYSAPVFLLTFTILCFYSIDVIIAKIVFDSTTAGEYAIASILSKTIFFGTFPIGKAMFPLSAERNRDNSSKIFAQALGILTFCIVSALAVFYFFPELLILIFSGKNIPSSSSILLYLALATSILSYANLTILYKLSRGNIRGYGFGIFFLIFEAILLVYFSQSLLSFSLAFLTSSALFLWWTVTFLQEWKDANI